MKKDKQLSDYIRDFNALLLSVEKEYNDCYKTVGDCEKATMDLLHQIELGEAKDRNKMATRLHRERVKRREAKDIMTILSPLKEWMDRNVGAISALRNVIGTTKVKERSSTRYYYPRIITDLPISTDNP